MARINIDDELFKDVRFTDLCILLGSSEAALGALVRSWTVAQGYWKHSDNGIPRVEWEKQRLKTEIIRVGLATETEEFIVVRGSVKHFGWLRLRAESGARGGKQKARNHSEIELAKASKHKQTLASPSYSLSLSSKEEENTYTRGIELKPEVKELLEAWTETLKKFGIPSAKFGSDIQLARIALRNGIEDTLLAVRGMREEQPSEKFKPAQWLTVSRLEKPANFERFRNLGSAANERDRREREITMGASEGLSGAYGAPVDEPAQGSEPAGPSDDVKVSRFLEALRAELGVRPNGIGQDGLASNHSP